MSVLTTTESCTECGGIVRHNRIEAVCESCGLVINEDDVDHGRGERIIDSKDCRTGAPLTQTRHDLGLSTEIGYGAGSDITGKRKRQLVRMRRQHNQAKCRSKSERNRRYAFTEIQRIVGALGLAEQIGEQACSLFKSAQSADLLYGRSLEGFAAGSVYATCRIRSIARTIEEIARVARADKSELKVAYDAMNRDLGLPVGPIDPNEYIPRYATELDLEPDVEKRAREHATKMVDQRMLGGKNPSGVAAACLYRAAYDLGVEITQQAVADLAGVSRMTIRSTVNDLKDLQS